MKVECIKMINNETGQDLDKSPWLTVGSIYQVLSVFISINGTIEYRLISDDNCTPALFNAVQFKIVSENLSPNWVANHELETYFELAPKSWTTDGFWERYFDGEPEAIKCFTAEKNIIISSNQGRNLGTLG